MRKIIFVLSFALLFTASFASAVKLKPIDALSIKEANISYNKESHSLSGVVKVQNPNREQKEFRIFVSFSSTQNGKELLRLPATKVLKAKPSSFIRQNFVLHDVVLPKGKYDILVLLDTAGLGVSSVKPVGTIKIEDSSAAPFKYTLRCSAASEDIKEGQVPVICTVNPSVNKQKKFSIEYEIKPAGVMRTQIKDVFRLPSVNTDTLRFNLPARSLSGGAMDVAVKLRSEDAVSNVSYFRYFMPGIYSRVVYVKNLRSEQKLNLYVNGSLYMKDRRLLIGLLDFDRICFYKDMDFYNIAPLNRDVSYRGEAKCGAQAKPFAIIYKARYESGQLDLMADDILDFKGLQDRESALSIVNTIFKKDKSLLNNISENLAFALASLVLLVLVLFAIIFAKKRALLVVLFLLVGFVTPSALTHAEVFDSLDAPKVRFEVNFPNITKEVGQNDNIVFSFAAIDNFSGGVNKYSGAEAYVWIDNASTTKVKIMDALDTNPVVIASLTNNLSLGVHTLNFEVPASTGICGAAYDFSDFDTAVFDPLPCEFSVDFTVVPGSKIALTFYAQPKAVPVGGSSKLYWTSSGASSCTASDGWSGAKALQNMAGESTGAISGAYQDFTLTCSNASESITKTDTVYTYVCGDGMCSQWEDCNLCSQDCGTCTAPQSVDITADPQLVREGGVSYITWHSNGFTHCVVSEDNPSINDTWDRLAGVEKTSALNGDTIYTVTCDDGGSNTMSKSVKVRIVPKYIEF